MFPWRIAAQEPQSLAGKHEHAFDNFAPVPAHETLGEEASMVVWLMNGTNLMQSIATTPERWGLELRIAGPK